MLSPNSKLSGVRMNKRIKRNKPKIKMDKKRKKKMINKRSPRCRKQMINLTLFKALERLNLI